jgi:HsdM N-terminal domain
MDHDPELERVVERMSHDPEWFEQEMIDRALAGDTKEALDVLERCAEHVLLGTLSEPMRNYLHDRLREVVRAAEGGHESADARAAKLATHSQRPQGMNQQNLADLIWDVADALRGPFRPSLYGRVLLPFTVLRRLEAHGPNSLLSALEDNNGVGR